MHCADKIYNIKYNYKDSSYIQNNKNWKITNVYEFKKAVSKFVKIRDFPEFLKFSKFAV